MNFLIEQLEAAVTQTEKIIFEDSAHLQPSTELYMPLSPKETEEQGLMLQHDERELSLFMIYQKQKIFQHLRQVEQKAAAEQSKPTRVVSPIKSTEPLPSLPSRSLPTSEELKEVPVFAKLDLPPPPSTASDPTTSKLLEHTISQLLYQLTHDPLRPHALVMTITAMAIDITMKTILQQIQFHSLSLPIFFEEVIDDRIKALQLFKLLDQSCISTDQRRRLRKQFEVIAAIQDESEWQHFVKETIRSFLIKHQVYLSLGAKESIKLYSSEVSLEKYLCDGVDHCSKVIILKAPQGRMKQAKHYLVPLLLPEVSAGLDTISFLPGQVIFNIL